MTFFTLLLRRTALVLAGALPAWAHAEPRTYLLDPQHTQVHWEVRHFGTSTSRGRLAQVDGQLRVDWAAGTGETSIQVRTASVDTGVPALDAMLRGEYFFASAEFPQAHFVSRRFHFAGGRLTGLVGELTVRDASVPLTLTARHFACRTDATSRREVCGGDFEGEVRRGELGITYGLPFVADRVRLVVQVEASAP